MAECKGWHGVSGVVHQKLHVHELAKLTITTAAARRAMPQCTAVAMHGLPILQRSKGHPVSSGVQEVGHCGSTGKGKAAGVKGDNPHGVC